MSEQVSEQAAGRLIHPIAGRYLHATARSAAKIMTRKSGRVAAIGQITTRRISVLSSGVVKSLENMGTGHHFQNPSENNGALGTSATTNGRSPSAEVITKSTDPVLQLILSRLETIESNIHRRKSSATADWELTFHRDTGLPKEATQLDPQVRQKSQQEKHENRAGQTGKLESTGTEYSSRLSPKQQTARGLPRKRRPSRRPSVKQVFPPEKEVLPEEDLNLF